MKAILEYGVRVSETLPSKDPIEPFKVCVMKRALAAIDERARARAAVAETGSTPGANPVALIQSRCQAEMNAVLEGSSNRSPDGLINIIATEVAKGSSPATKTLYESSLKSLRDETPATPRALVINKFLNCVISERLAMVERTMASAPVSSGTQPSTAPATAAPATASPDIVTGVATPSQTSSSAITRSSSPAQGGSGPHAHGWNCNPLGACLVRVSELRGFDKVKQICPAMIPMHGDGADQDQFSGVWAPDKESAESNLKLWEDNLKYLSAGRRKDLIRLKAYIKCRQANDWEPKATTYGFVDSLRHGSVESTKALWLRITTGDRERVYGPGAPFFGEVMMPASRYDKFMTTTDEGDLKVVIYRWETHPNPVPYVSATCAASLGVLGTENPPFHHTTASLVATLDTLRAYRSKIQMTLPNGPTQIANVLTWLECLERNNWPDTAEDTYYVVHKYGPAARDN